MATLSIHIDNVLKALHVHTTELRYAAGRQALDHILTENRSSGKELSMNKIYKLIQDDFDITRPCAESRLRRFQLDVLNTLDSGTVLTIFGTHTDVMTNHEFIYKLARHIARTI